VSITTDILLTPQPLASAAIPAMRPAIAPTAEREGANQQRRESDKNEQSGLNFRAVLSATTLNDIARVAASAEASIRSASIEERPRREMRLPGKTPVEISGAEAADLFTQALANNSRKSRAPEFEAATSRYASSYFAGSAFYARPGEALELTA